MVSKLEKLFKNESNYTILLIIIMLAMTSVMMLLYSPLCPGGDFYVHFNRLVVLMEALSDGSYPIYMDYYMIDGYGYLIKAFYCDVLLLPFAIIGNFTSPTFAYQSIVFTFTLFCGFFTYIAAKKVLKCKYAAVMTALLYTFCTYRIFDIYVRGALGEVMSFTLLPIVLLGAYEIVKGDYKRWYILTIGFSLLIYSHVISTVLTAFTLLIFLCIYYKAFVKEPKRLLYLVVAAAVCLPITASYMVPMIEQMLSNSFYYDTHKITTGVTGYKLNEVISGLFNTISLRNEQLFPKLGAILIFVITSRILVKEKTKERNFADMAVIVGLVFILMTTPLLPWNIYPFKLLSVIQFPWRLLEYTSFLFAFAGGYYLSRILKDGKQKIVATSLLIISFILIFNSDSIHYRTFICNNNKPTIEVNTSFRGIIGGEYLPSKLPSNYQVYDIPNVYNDFIHHRGQVVEGNNETTQISNFTKNKGHLTFNVELKEKDNLELPLTYYIGYKATLDGNEIAYQQSENGLIEVPITASGKMEIEYVGTTLQYISLWITIASIILLSIFVARSQRNVNKKINKI